MILYVSFEQMSWANFGVVLLDIRNSENSEIQICANDHEVLLKSRL